MRFTYVVFILLSMLATSGCQQTAENQGNALYRQGNYDEAIKAYDEVIKLDPTDADAWCNKGTALYHLGKYDEAIIALDESIRLNPNEAVAWGFSAPLSFIGANMMKQYWP